jgi:L-fuconolactonase
MDRAMTDIPIIDSHQHFWRTGEQQQDWLEAHHGALRQDFLPEHLRPLLHQAGIKAAITMQSVDSPQENDLLLHYEQDDLVAGVVSWLPMKAPAHARVELDRIRFTKQVGVRCLVADDPLAWLANPDVIDLFRQLASRGLVWDVVPITAQQTEAVSRLAAKVPDLRIVVDHMGRPPIDSGGWEPWATNLSRLAEAPNIAIKLSIGINVLSAWRNWDIAAARPYIQHVTASFEPDRLMLGSNWPVVLLGADYLTAWSDLRSVVFSEFPDPSERAAILGGTAIETYGLMSSGEREGASD